MIGNFINNIKCNVIDSSATGFTRLSIQLDPAWGLDKVQSIGIKVEPTSGTGNAFLYLDDVELSN